MADQEPDVGGSIGPADVLPLDRFNAFSDGVFAIAITLLVLELTVPIGPERLLPALVEQWPEFLGYLISFAFIGGSWIGHARMTKLLKHGDSIVFEINLVFLLFIAVLPFTTSLMVTHLSGPDVEVGVLIYGLNGLAASLMLTFLNRYLARERTLVRDEIADEQLAALARQRRIATALWLIAIASALFAPPVAVGLYVAATALMLAVPLLRLGRSRRRASSPKA